VVRTGLLQPGPSRSQSIPSGLFSSASSAGDYGTLTTPGGFRRDYLHRLADERGIPEDQRPSEWNEALLDSIQPRIIVGHFDAVLGIRFNPDTGKQVLGVEGKGEASVSTVTIAVVKSFVGAGVTFLPGAFRLGGWLFSFLAVLFVGLCNGVCIGLLLDCREKTDLSSFASVAFAASGPLGSAAVQVSLVLSQFATCAAYMVFIAKIALSLQLGPLLEIFAVLLPLLVPLTWIRKVDKLEIPNLIADSIIFLCLALMVVCYFQVMGSGGGLIGHLEDLPAMEPASAGVFLGTIIFTFEGIPMILPIRESMREPEQFWPLFKPIFGGIVVFFALFGLVGFAANGARVHEISLNDLPLDVPGQVARAAFCVALVCSFPLQFLPAARITELWMFGEVRAGCHTWQKNSLRTLEVLLLMVVALCGGAYFEQFLAIVGAVCCAPIAFIYPALFHFKLCARSFREAALDMAMMFLGFAAMALALRDSLL